ncbi:MAG TPA: hypothetical protein PLC48_09260 [Ferruginibacter sp.]|nr:hypothetical protein [Ferruginibacter sp.]
MNKLYPYLFYSLILFMLNACTGRKISATYYNEHSAALDSIEDSYQQLYQHHPFSIGFTDIHFKTVSVEILTDSLKYIYEFSVDEKRLPDSLERYGLNVAGTMALIRNIQRIHCTWINKVNYYVDEKRHSMIFISIKPVAVTAPFSYKKYYVLAYFRQPQYFDDQGRLLDRRKRRRLRMINGDIFRRINDKVCYTISGKFR